jgi:hypothetical protein
MMMQAGVAGPPDTSTYYHIAYAWAAILYTGYSLLLWSRGRRVRARLRAARGQSASPGSAGAAARRDA